MKVIAVGLLFGWCGTQTVIHTGYTHTGWVGAKN